LPKGASAFEKVSAAIAVRTALCAHAAHQVVLFVVPEASASTARYVTAGLLIGNHVHTNALGQLPTEEVRPLFRGDILLITAAVSECKGELDDLRLAGGQRLKDIWEVVPFSKYSKSTSKKPRVFLANPGWVLNGVAGRQFGAVVIDASHPRTYARLTDLARAAAECGPLRIVVTPPMAEPILRTYGYPSRASMWLWDPRAMTDAEAIVGPDRFTCRIQLRSSIFQRMRKGRLRRRHTRWR
jgi:hypothetical protein